MKLSYIHSGGFRGLFSIGFILAVITLLGSCSSELADLSGEQLTGSENAAVSQDPSMLRFQTMEELENISVSDIPGDHEGFELKELTYECVDTIELRALRLDVTATLASATQEKVVSFEAEVGPELVSVEYYPTVEVVPTHDNLTHHFYPKVERYRNYSDGPRIGPDEFYDYGHFLQAFLFTTDVLKYPGVTGGDLKLISWWDDYNYSVNPECIYYENGVFYEYHKGIIEYNLNTVVIEDEGASHTGEDLFHIIPQRQVSDSYQIRDEIGKIRGNYYRNTAVTGVWDPPCYIPSRIYNSDDEVYEYLNLCKDVPDVSPIKYPEDTKSLSPGWYFGDFSDFYAGYHGLYSKRELTIDDSSYERKGFRISPEASVYLQYLVIDNRIIHFDDVALKDYCGAEALCPTFDVSKTSSGYMIRAEFEVTLYGERFKGVYDLELKGVYGPTQTIDKTQYNETERQDQVELDNLSTRSGNEQSDRKSLISREDGKIMTIDCHLPKSLDKITSRRSIKRNQK